jgi:GMP synthase-like glutamine amidotransferase
MRALTIANKDDADIGFVGDRLRHHGYAFEECLREYTAEWPQLDGHELVLLLGSEWSVYWPDVAHHVDAEVTLVREAARRGIPIFGICFGHQVMAHAFGGSVHRSPTPEVGWMHVDTDVPDVVAAGPWLEWHYDSVALPPHATEMARSAAGPQAWRAGRLFATQFHPEANESVVRRWSAGVGADELARIGTTPDELLIATRASVDAARANTDRLVDWFVETIVTSAFVDVVDTRRPTA